MIMRRSDAGFRIGWVSDDGAFVSSPRLHVVEDAGRVPDRSWVDAMTDVSALRLAIVDNDAFALKGIEAGVTRSLPAARFLWAVRQGREAFEHIRFDEAQPDIVLVDMSLEDTTGTEVCAEIRRQTAYTALLAITSFSLRRYADRVRDAGAQGIVAKDNIANICSALNDIQASGTLSIQLGVRTYGFDTAREAHNRVRCARSLEMPLTTRELQAVELCAKGNSLAETAAIMQVNIETVKTNLKRAEHKIGVSSRARIVAWWWEREH